MCTDGPVAWRQQTLHKTGNVILSPTGSGPGGHEARPAALGVKDDVTWSGKFLPRSILWVFHGNKEERDSLRREPRGCRRVRTWSAHEEVGEGVGW